MAAVEITPQTTPHTNGTNGKVTPSGLEERFMTLHEIVRAAKANLAPNPWDYLVGGSETETTLRRNRLAIDSLGFRPRVLRDVSKIDTSRVWFGRRLRLPVMLAPIGSIESFTPEGGATAARSAYQFGVAHMLSSVCAPGLEGVAEAAPDALRIFQLYVRGDQDFVDDYIRRARDNGYTAFSLTVDTAIYSRRERDIAKRFVRGSRAAARGTEAFQAALNWEQVKRFKNNFDIPLIIKGIATPEDALQAVDYGVNGVYISNHGGRQLDQGRGTLDILPEVVQAIGGKADIIVDGGFYRGTDFVKAIALGATIVGIGRLQGWALAAAGQPGMVRALELLEDEIRIAMGLLGVTTLEELNPSYVCAAPPTVPTHVFSAFPLLDLDNSPY
jgi:isopentenyl diphosphate isomerase/L-lactate dehydrogenase-like FMN-dependent dehydrogenase